MSISCHNRYRESGAKICTDYISLIWMWNIHNSFQKKEDIGYVVGGCFSGVWVKCEKLKTNCFKIYANTFSILRGCLFSVWGVPLKSPMGACMPLHPCQLTWVLCNKTYALIQRASEWASSTFLCRQWRILLAWLSILEKSRIYATRIERASQRGLSLTRLVMLMFHDSTRLDGLTTASRVRLHSTRLDSILSLVRFPKS